MPTRLLPVNESFLRPAADLPLVETPPVARPPVRSLPINETSLKSNVCGIADEQGKHVIPIAEARVPVDEHGIWQFAASTPQVSLGTYRPPTNTSSSIDEAVLTNINNALHDLMNRINAIYDDLSSLSNRIDNVAQSTLTWELN